MEGLFNPNARGRLFVDGFYIKGERSEAIVATNHGAHRILHPSVVEVATALRQGFDELAHRQPCRGAQAFRAFPVDGCPRLSLLDVAGMLEGVLVFGDEVGVGRLAEGRYLHFLKRGLSRGGRCRACRPYPARRRGRRRSDWR